MKRSGRAFSKYRIKRYRGTRYLANDPKVVSMGIGNAGIKEVVKGGFIVSIFISADFHAVDQLIDDERSWHHFIGGLSAHC